MSWCHMEPASKPSAAIMISWENGRNNAFNPLRAGYSSKCYEILASLVAADVLVQKNETICIYSSDSTPDTSEVSYKWFVLIWMTLNPKKSCEEKRIVFEGLKTLAVP